MADIISPLQDTKLEESPFLKNIAEDQDKETLFNIGNAVVEDYQDDLGSREGWDGRIEKWYKLFTGLVEKKTWPWDGASNVNIPLLSISCLQFQARAYEALLPPKEIAKCFSTDGQTVDVAERCQKYLNWQLSEGEWDEDMDVMLLQLPIFGVGVKKTYYDPVKARVVSKTLRVDEFVAPYGVKRLEDSPRMTHVYEKYLNDIKINGELGIWTNLEDVEDVEAGVDTGKPADQYTEVSDEATGISPSMDSKDRPRVILEQHRTWDLDGDGIEERYIITVDKETRQVLRIESSQQDYFTSYNFIPNPESWMGFGFGHLLEHLNHSANSLINQLIDAGALSNTISGYYNRKSGIKDGDIAFDMGEFKGIDMSTDDIRKAIYINQFNPPSNVLFALLQLLQGYARELSSVSETMLGQLPPSDTTATSMLTVMEQGLKVFSTIYKRQHRSLKKELKKIVALNSIYLDETEYFTVQDSTSNEIRTLQSGKADFAATIDVIPTSDPTITSRAERLIKARQAYELSLQSPAIANDPEAMYFLLYNLYDALEVKNIDQILKPPQPPPPPPDLRPEEEEAEFLAERWVDPLPHQDHGAHLESHRAFEGSPFAQQLTPQGKKLLEGHIRETLALFYLQVKQSEEVLNGFNAGGLGAVAGEPVQSGATGDIVQEEGIGGAGLTP